MASRHGKSPRRGATHVERAVVELVNSGNTKAALRRTEQLLSQHPSSALHKVLRALAVDLAEHHSEALILCQDVSRQRPTDPQVLGHIRTVFQKAALFADVTALYEAAFEDEPRKEEIGIGLFLALATELKFAKQQQVAQQLLRVFKKPVYALWSIGSILTQEASALQPQRALDLAEALLMKIPVELARQKRDGASSEALRQQYIVLLLHLATLRQERKHTQALRLLQAHQDGVPLQSDTERLRLQLVTEAGLAGGCAVARARVIRNADQWMAVREYIFVAFLKDGHLDNGGAIPLRVPPVAAHTTTSMSPSTATTPHHGVAGFMNNRGGRDLSPSATDEVSSPAMVKHTSTTGKGTKAGDSVQAGAEGALKGELVDFAGRTGGAALSSGTVEAKGVSEGAVDAPSSLNLDLQSGAGVQDAYNLFKHLQRSASDHGSRTPFLAELEMRAMAFACSELEASERGLLSPDPLGQPGWYSIVSPGDLADFIDGIAAYYHRHGHYGCCYSDLKPYLIFLDETKASSLLRKLQAIYLERKGPTNNWASRCANAQLTLTMWQVRRGLRLLEGLPFEQAVEEVNQMLMHWELLYPYVAEDAARVAISSGAHGPRAKCMHGLRDEMQPSPNLNEVLCMAAGHLLDMDRAYCVQLAGQPADGNQPALPCLHDRTYLLDALLVLELGAKLSPHCNHLRLLLVALYASIGAAVPAWKSYEAAGLSEQQDTALSYLALDRFLLIGWWEELPEIYQQLAASQDRLIFAARLEVARCYEMQQAQSMHRSREFIGILEMAESSVMYGRAPVEEAMLRLLRMSTVEAMAPYLKEVADRVSEVAKRAPSFWKAAGISDRMVFEGLHFLPAATPLQALQLGAIGAPVFLPKQSNVSVPRQWTASFRPRQSDILVSSVASAWPAVSADGESASWAAAANRATKAAPPPPAEQSALEELLAPRREVSGMVLHSRSLLLLILNAMMRSPPSEDDLSKHLRDLQATLAAEGLALNCSTVDMQILFPQDSGTALAAESSIPDEAMLRSRTRASEVFPAGLPAERSEQEPSPAKLHGSPATKEAYLPPPWRHVSRAVDDLFWRFTILTCDAAHRYLQAVRLSTSAVVAAAASVAGSPRASGDLGSGLARRSAPGGNSTRTRTLTSLQAAYTSGGVGMNDEEGEAVLAELASPPPGLVWDTLVRCINVLKIMVQECGKVILAEPTPCRMRSSQSNQSTPAENNANQTRKGAPEVSAFENPFCMGGHGLQVLCSFVLGPLLAFVPAVLLMSSRMAKSMDTGKAVAVAKRPTPLPASPKLDKAKFALRNLCDEMLSVLRQISHGLEQADSDTYDHWRAGGQHQSAPLPRCDFFTNQKTLGPHTMDLARVQRLVSNTMVTSYRKQLKAVAEHLHSREEILTSISLRLTQG